MTHSIYDIEDSYAEAIEYLNDNYAYFLTNVLNIGAPQWTNEIPTAAVTMSKDSAKGAEGAGLFGFLFNPDFAESLTPKQFAFVLSHETMHIVLYHLTLSHGFHNKEIFNIAADCVINDYLEGAGLECIEGICRGQDVVGFNCANSTVTDIYSIIENDPELQEKLGIGEDGEPQFFQIDSHDWMHDPEAIDNFIKAMAEHGFTPESLPDDLEEILNEAVNEYKKTQLAGKGQGKEEFMREQKVSLKWIELLEKLDPDMFNAPGVGPRPVSTFRTPRRKLMSLHPKIILPSTYSPDKGEMSRRSDKKPAIVLALDTSGSIGTDTSNKFVNLGRSIPRDKVEVFACTFTSQYMPLDLDNPRWRGGGTCFSTIEDFIQTHVVPENDGNYPKAVVVVTDGYAGFYGGHRPSKENAEGWFWLLLTNSQVTETRRNLAAQYGFRPENFEPLNGYTSNSASWSANKAV